MRASDSTLILRARGSELSAAEGVAVYGTAPQFFVGEDPDDHAEITFTGGLGQTLHVEAGGNIQVNVVSEDNASSSLIIDQVLSNHGNVTIVAPHGITAYDADSVIQGKRIQLNIASGSVGTSDLPLPVNSSYRQDGGVSILAEGDIYLRETFGNLLLAEPTAWDDPAASIYSSAGNVAITTINGSIIDGWIEGAQVLTAEEVNQLDSNLQLSGAAAEEAALTAIRSEENKETSLYHNYWSDERELTRNDSAAANIAISGIDFGANQLTTSTSHGLSSGDQVFFQPAEGLADALNLGAETDYYAIVTGSTNLQLAASRYDAVIADSPVVLGITQHSQIDAWNGFELQTFGYTTTSYDAAAAVDTDYSDIHTTYGSQAYDPNFIYQLSAQEQATRIAERTFDTASLKFPMSRALVDYLYPNVDTLDLSGGAAAPAENANIYANHLTLTVRADNGGRIGNVSDATTLDLSSGFESLSEAEKGLLGTAVAEDVVGHTYVLHEYLGKARHRRSGNC